MTSRIFPVKNVKNTLKYFKAAFQLKKYPQSGYFVKTRFVYGKDTNNEPRIWKKDNTKVPNDTAHIWLKLNDILNDSFFTSAIEVPEGWNNMKINQSFIVDESEIEDWMIPNDGNIFGGFSLRLYREELNEKEKNQFDDYIGLKCFQNDNP